MKKLLCAIMLCLLIEVSYADAARIKDIASLHGVRNNQLIGYGLVTGLSGTGDDLGKSAFTRQALYNMLARQGVNLNAARLEELDVKNVAAVMVTATLPPFAKSGAAVDVQVSSLGDAASLAGGTLMMTPLKAPNGQIYAVAQGALTLAMAARVRRCRKII